MIDGFKRNARIYVGDCIVRKADSGLSKGEDVVDCLPGARIEHVTEREYSRPREENIEVPYWYTSGRAMQTRKEQQR